MFRDDHDAIGAPDVRRRQPGVVAANLGARSFGMIHEVEIVNHHQAGCPTTGHQQGMGRLDDVGRGGGQPLDRRPFQPMPGVVQEPDRDAPVDRDSSGDLTGRQPVFPRRGEENEPLPVWLCGHEGAHRFVNVFADSGPLAERGSVVDENPHHGTRRMLSRAS